MSMARRSSSVIAATGLMLLGTSAHAIELVCIHPERPNQTFQVARDQGVYTWDDHGIERSWELKCQWQSDASVTCHKSEGFGERGSSVTMFRMLPDGSLVEAGYWALLKTSRVRVTPGFKCTTQGE